MSPGDYLAISFFVSSAETATQGSLNTDSLQIIPFHGRWQEK